MMRCGRNSNDGDGNPLVTRPDGSSIMLVT